MKMIESAKERLRDLWRNVHERWAGLANWAKGTIGAALLVLVGGVIWWALGAPAASALPWSSPPTPTPSPTLGLAVAEALMAAPAEATATPTPTGTATFTPSPSLTPTDTATATATPTETSTVTPTPTPTIDPRAAAQISGRVVRVIDGDTIQVDIDGATYDVRYVGIDAPDKGEDEALAEWLAQEASVANQALVLGETVVLERDLSETDLQGRLLRYVWVEGAMAQAELVRRGLALAAPSPPDTRYQEQLAQLEAQAREAGRGLWGEPPPDVPTPAADPPVVAFTATPAPGAPTRTPVSGTATTAPNVLTPRAETPTPTTRPASPTAEAASPTPLPETPTTAPTSTSAPPMDEPQARLEIVAADIRGKPEFVEIANTGNAPQEMAGWWLLSVRGAQRYDFPADLLLMPGMSVRVYSGPNARHDPPTALKWSDRTQWNNKGDPAELYNADGQLISAFAS